MSSLKLLVKSPSDGIPIFGTECDLVWCVSDLKHHLSTVYPTKPPVASQRIIHAGKMLKDDEALDSIFTSIDEAQIVHLVCRNGSRPATKSSDVSPMVPSTSSTQGDTQTQLPSEAEMEQYRQQYLQYLQNFYLNAANRATASADVTNTTSRRYFSNEFTGYFPHDGNWSCYYYPWFNFGAAGFPPPSTQHMAPQPSGSNTAPTTQTADSHLNFFLRGARAVMAEFGLRQGEVPQDENGNEVVAAPADAAAGGGGGDGNAQQPPQPMMFGNALAGAGGLMGAEAVDDDGGEVDIVDRFYMLFRLGLFVMLCVFYSSPDKALIVFSIVAYVYFYNIYRRHAANRQAVAVPPPPVNQNGEDRQQPQRAVISSEGSNSQSVSAASNGSEQTVRQRNAEMQLQISGTNNTVPTGGLAQENPALTNRLGNTLRSIVLVSYQFISSFITSIVPEQPPPLRLD